LKVRVRGNITSGVHLNPSHPSFKRKIQRAARKGRSYFIHGFRMKPKASDARRVENRIWFDRQGKPVELEVYLVTRKADGSARPAKSLKVKWPSS
jgi:hypothetical protein